MPGLPINHLNLTVPDVAATRDFFCDQFGFTCAKPHDALSILDGSDGFVLTVMALKPYESASWPDGFHLGVYVSEPEVSFHHQRLTDAGFAPGQIMRLHRGTMFYVTAPGDILVEVCCPH